MEAAARRLVVGGKKVVQECRLLIGRRMSKGQRLQSFGPNTADSVRVLRKEHSVRSRYSTEVYRYIDRYSRCLL